MPPKEANEPANIFPKTTKPNASKPVASYINYGILEVLRLRAEKSKMAQTAILKSTTRKVVTANYLPIHVLLLM